LSIKASKFTWEQIAYALRLADLGAPVSGVCCKMGISEAKYFRWKQKYGGLGISELHKLRHL
jgi:putative transposase